MGGPGGAGPRAHHSWFPVAKKKAKNPTHVTPIMCYIMRGPEKGKSKRKARGKCHLSLAERRLSMTSSCRPGSSPGAEGAWLVDCGSLLGLLGVLLLLLLLLVV